MLSWFTQCPSHQSALVAAFVAELPGRFLILLPEEFLKSFLSPFSVLFFSNQFDVKFVYGFWSSM